MHNHQVDPFGMIMPDRKSQGTDYRFGFNGKENDNEVKGFGNEVDYDNRIYDSRIGRWLSVDPLQSKYPNESPYIFTSDNPIFYADRDGKDKITTVSIINKDGTVTQFTRRDTKYFDYLMDQSASGGYIYSRRDVYQHIVFDMRESAMGSSTIKSVETTYGDPHEVTGGHFWFGRNFNSLGNTLGDLASDIRGDESDHVKYGYVILGRGENPEYTHGLPKAADGSEVLDLGDWLDFAGGLREGATVEELTEDLIKKFGGVKGDMKSVKEALDVMNNQLSNISESVAKIEDAVELIKKQKEEQSKGEGTTSATVKPDANSSAPDSATCFACSRKEDSAHIDKNVGKGTFNYLKKIGATDKTKKR